MVHPVVHHQFALVDNQDVTILHLAEQMEENKMFLSFASFRISLRKPTACLGSKPAVGSSSSRISGFRTGLAQVLFAPIALDKLPITRRCTSVMPAGHDFCDVLVDVLLMDADAAAELVFSYRQFGYRGGTSGK